MASLTDWLARTFYISAQDEKDAAEVAAKQQQLLDNQLAAGKVDALAVRGLLARRAGARRMSI